jgi:hypothetical protein
MLLAQMCAYLLKQTNGLPYILAIHILQQQKMVVMSIGQIPDTDI